MTKVVFVEKRAFLNIKQQLKKQFLPPSIVCFFEVRFFGSFGQLAVQAAQIWAVFGRRPW